MKIPNRSIEDAFGIVGRCSWQFDEHERNEGTDSTIPARQRELECRRIGAGDYERLSGIASHPSESANSSFSDVLPLASDNHFAYCE